MLDQLTVDDFLPYVGRVFLAGQPEAQVELQLLEASSLRGGRPGVRASFALLFRGPADPALDQRVHPLTHPTRGSMQLFLVPIGPDEVGQRYEAIFN